MINNWNDIEKQHVLQAIQKYNETGLKAYSKNTFLVHNKILYPAKHIRAMAYEIAFGLPADKSTFSGGLETVNFFEKIGFEVDYKPKVELAKLDDKSKKIKAKSTDGAKINQRGVVEQKNALQLNLNKYFNGDLVSEKTFEWMRTPMLANLPSEYTQIVDALRGFRGNPIIGQSNYGLRCDFVSETHKMIIEYDERQHFTKARGVALVSYPETISLDFDKEYWIKNCDSISARDNHPHNRDEIRAFYDSVRDIEAFKNGYKLIRIKHGDFDWNSKDSYENLDKIIKKVNEHQSFVTEIDQSLNEFDWRSFEVELQRIRLLYLKWLFDFKPISCDALDTCKYNDKIYIIDSPYGRSFSLSPAGIGNVYAGGGKGVLKLIDGSYTKNDELMKTTNQIKNSLDGKTKELKGIIRSLVEDKKYPLVWEYLQNFWWLRLGMHEFVYDTNFESESIPTNDVRDYVLVSIYNKIDLSKETPTIFSDEEILHSLRYKFAWNRYGICSYDCGPLAFGREKFVPFKVAANQVKRYFNDYSDELINLKIDEKRSFAANSLRNLYDFQILYHEDPIGFFIHDDFDKNKEELKVKITEVEDRLNQIIDMENLNIG